MRLRLSLCVSVILVAALVFLGVETRSDLRKVSLLSLPIVQAQQISWPDPPYNPTNVSCSTATCTLVAAPTALAECVYGLSLINAGASADTVSIYLDGGTTAVASVYLAASGGAATWDLKNNPKNPWFITNSTTAFVVKSGTTVQLNGSVYAANCP